MTSDNTAKTIFVTGSAQRLGAAMIELFHNRGYQVIIHCNNSLTEAQALQRKLNEERPHSAYICKGSLKDPEAIADQVKAITTKLDVLVNNASAFYPTPLESITYDDWDVLMESNAKAPLFLTKALLPILQNGSIINMVDIHAQKPLAEHTIYCMAKAANQMLTLSLAKELAPQVRVNGIAPGAILWPSENDKNIESTAEVTEDYKDAVLEKVPLNRLGTIQDITETVWFFAEGPGYITGQIVSVDGGRTLNQ